MLIGRSKREKIFCIGFGKTGTTTIEKVLTNFGYKMGHQPTAELLAYAYHERDFGKIIKYCQSAQAFQDIPFSAPYLFIVLDQAFPNAKFILTVRDSAEQWYNSLITFHSKKWTNGERVPNKEDLLKTGYRTPTFSYDTKNILYGTQDDDLYNKEQLIKVYQNHNETVRDYFRTKSNFIEVNVSNDDDYPRLAKFLNKKDTTGKFPWLNKT